MNTKKLDDVDIRQLYRTAWKHWGPNTQIDILIEEMAELTQALLKARRNGFIFSGAVFEEMADVSICLDQLLMESDYLEKSQDFYTYKEDKLIRLRERLMVSMTEKYENDTPAGASGGGLGRLTPHRV